MSYDPFLIIDHGLQGLRATKAHTLLLFASYSVLKFESPDEALSTVHGATDDSLLPFKLVETNLLSLEICHFSSGISTAI